MFHPILHQNENEKKLPTWMVGQLNLTNKIYQQNGPYTSQKKYTYSRFTNYNPSCTWTKKAQYRIRFLLLLLVTRWDHFILLFNYEPKPERKNWLTSDFQNNLNASYIWVKKAHKLVSQTSEKVYKWLQI